MALEINIQDILGDMARSNLFEVEIPFLGENFKFRCKASSLPADTVGKVEVDYQNRKIGLPGDRTYDDWNVTVYNDESQDSRRQFIQWSEDVVRHGRQIAGNSPESVKKVAYVRQYARDGETVTVQYKITGIFPINVGEIALEWAEGAEAETFEVTFSIDWWEEV